jgi:hypothetical protein
MSHDINSTYIIPYIITCKPHIPICNDVCMSTGKGKNVRKIATEKEKTSVSGSY